MTNIAPIIRPTLSPAVERPNAARTVQAAALTACAGLVSLGASIHNSLVVERSVMFAQGIEGVSAPLGAMLTPVMAVSAYLALRGTHQFANSFGPTAAKAIKVTSTTAVGVGALVGVLAYPLGRFFSGIPVTPIDELAVGALTMAAVASTVAGTVASLRSTRITAK